jgi:hypothetical protein
MTPVCALTLICSFITSPQAGAPTMPVPTVLVALVERADIARVLVVVYNFFAEYAMVLPRSVSIQIDQWAAHWMVLMSMPSWYISHSGLRSRSLATLSLKRFDRIVDLLLGRVPTDRHAQAAVCASSSLRPSARNT